MRAFYCSLSRRSRDSTIVIQSAAQLRNFAISTSDLPLVISAVQAREYLSVNRPKAQRDLHSGACTLHPLVDTSFTAVRTNMSWSPKFRARRPYSVTVAVCLVDFEVVNLLAKAKFATQCPFLRLSRTLKPSNVRSQGYRSPSPTCQKHAQVLILVTRCWRKCRSSEPNEYCFANDWYDFVGFLSPACAPLWEARIQRSCDLEKGMPGVGECFKFGTTSSGFPADRRLLRQHPTNFFF